MERKRVSIAAAEIKNNRLLLTVNEPLCHLEPAGQMLVDSDQLSFIYLMDDSEDYTYIVLTEPVWPLLRTAVEQKLSVFLKCSQEQTALVNFLEELEFLISNIKDNSNYGEAFATKVEQHFQTSFV